MWPYFCVQFFLVFFNDIWVISLFQQEISYLMLDATDPHLNSTFNHHYRQTVASKEALVYCCCEYTPMQSNVWLLNFEETFEKTLDSYTSTWPTVWQPNLLILNSKFSDQLASPLQHSCMNITMNAEESKYFDPSLYMKIKSPDEISHSF